jgi:hypothetical protein
MFTPFLLTLALVPTDAPANTRLPADWHGRWVGTLKITPVDGKEQETPMELTIEPLKDSKNLRWRIIYGEGKKAPVREYELQLQEKANRFVIDEKNGVLIDAILVGGVLHSLFEVGGSLIPVRYERIGDVLRFSLTVSSTRDPRESKLTGKEDFNVKAYKIESYHVAELRKAK